MPVKIVIPMGDLMRVEIDGNDIKSTLQRAGFFGEVAAKCRGRKNLVWTFRNPQGYEFYGLKDLDSGEELQLGQTKEGGRLFPKDWQEPYHGNPDDQEPQGGSPHGQEDQTGEPPPEDEPGDDTPPDYKPQRPAPQRAAALPARRDYQMRGQSAPARPAARPAPRPATRANPNPPADGGDQW